MHKAAAFGFLKSNCTNCFQIVDGPRSVGGGRYLAGCRGWFYFLAARGDVFSCFIRRFVLQGEHCSNSRYDDDCDHEQPGKVTL